MNIKSRARPLIRVATGLLACLTALLGACLPNFGSLRASAFFKGDYLRLAQAIERHDMAELTRLGQGRDLGQKGERDMDLMWFAIVRKNFDAIRTLVALGVNPDTQLADGIGSALQAAFMHHDDTRYLQAMLDGGLSPNHQHPDYHPMLHRGVFGGLEHVKLLLQRGTRIDERTPHVRYTALQEAISRVKPDIAIYLVQQGADFNTYTVIGVSPAWGIHLAINRTEPGNPVHEKFLALRDLLIEKGAQWPPASPLEVREQMRGRGETPVVPRGHER